MKYKHKHIHGNKQINKHTDKGTDTLTQTHTNKIRKVQNNGQKGKTLKKCNFFNWQTVNGFYFD